jgi:hypothetical protein
MCGELVARSAAPPPLSRTTAWVASCALLLLLCSGGAPSVSAADVPQSNPQHVFDFTAELVEDVGAAASWGVSSRAGGGAAQLSYRGLSLNGSRRGGVMRLTPDVPVTGAMTISITASYSSASGNVTRTLFDFGGIHFRLNPEAMAVGGVHVHSFADVANVNGASVRCSQVRACINTLPISP